MAPQLVQSSRPNFGSKAELSSYLNATLASTSYAPRTPWKRLCPGGVLHQSSTCSLDPAAELAWIPARFGHTAAMVSASRMLIYGGYLCQSVDSETGVCNQVVLGNDLWEFDTVQALAGRKPFRQLGLDPKMRGAIGQVALTVAEGAGATHQILIFGGAPEMFFVYAINNNPPPAVSADIGQMEVRQVLYRVNKVRNSSAAGPGCLSFHTVVRTETGGILFGGYARNSMTSAVYVHDLVFRAPSTTLSLLTPIADSPVPRGYAGIVKASDSSLVMFSGTGLQADASACLDAECCGSTSGVWDIWSLDLSRQLWSKMPSTNEPTPLSLGGFSSFFVNDIVAMVLMGGIWCGYKSGVTFTDRVADCLAHGQCDHHPTSALQVAIVQNGVSTGIKVRTVSTDQVPEIRCLPILQIGDFVEQKQTLIMFAGLSGYGRALSDLWLVDVTRAILFQSVEVSLAGRSAVPFNSSLFLSFLSRAPGCNAETVGIYGSVAVLLASQNKIRIAVDLVSLDFVTCLLPLIEAPNAFAALAAGTPFVGYNISADLSTARTEIYLNSSQYTMAIPDNCGQQQPGTNRQINNSKSADLNSCVKSAD